MFIYMRYIFCKALNSTCRNLCTKSLVLKKTPRKKKLTKDTLNEIKKTKSTKKKTKVVVRHPSDYCEDLWLEGLTASNLKLFRKTSIGSFKKINVNNLIAKLKLIYPELNSANVCLQKDSLETVSNSDNLLDKPKVNNEGQELASPQLSEFLVKNILKFPMLREHSDNPLTAVFADEKDDYGVVDSANFPSVSKILNETMSPAARKRLEDWNQAMIKKMGEKEFQMYSKDPETKQSINDSHRQRKRILIDLLAQGAKLHRCLKTYLETGNMDEVVVDPEIRGCWDSLNKLLPNISDVKMVEEHVRHPVLMYKGVVDCVANYQNMPCVIEWKKSKRIKKNLSDTYDAPLQLCAYLGALSWQKSFFPATQGLVVVAYSTGIPADVFVLDSESCRLYWMQWLKRLQDYWEFFVSETMEIKKEMKNSTKCPKSTVPTVLLKDNNSMGNQNSGIHRFVESTDRAEVGSPENEGRRKFSKDEEEGSITTVESRLRANYFMCN